MNAPPPPDTLERFFAGAYRRIQWTIVGCGALAAAGAWYRYGPRMALGVLLGAALAYINFVWLKSSMLAVSGAYATMGAGTEATPPPSPPTMRLAIRFFLRYVLAAAIAYAILASSAVSAYGLLAGLLMIVPALLVEAGHEAWRTLGERS